MWGSPSFRRDGKKLAWHVWPPLAPGPLKLTLSSAAHEFAVFRDMMRPQTYRGQRNALSMLAFNQLIAPTGAGSPENENRASCYTSVEPL